MHVTHGRTSKTRTSTARTGTARTARRRGISLLSVSLLGIPVAAMHHARPVSALVRAGSTAAAAHAVRAHGGAVTNDLSVIEGVIAEIDPARVGELAADPTVSRVDLDTDGGMASVINGTTYDTETQVGSMYSTARLVGADKLWAQGVTGGGVGVALIDSGVQASTFFGARLVGGADFSGAGNPLADGYGHGTHMAGIIAGSSGMIGRPSAFTGIAPRSTLVSVRVADSVGASSLLKILQGIDWVYKNRLLYNIKVANLSLGVPAYADYTSDPLVAASQRLWSGGVTVVASAGNIGQGLNLTSPAIDPMIIAVGGVDTKGTIAPADDTVAAFSASAVSATDRAPTVVVPARSILSLRATGSLLSRVAPGSAVGTKFMKGTGTSQAAAVVSGQAALLLSMNPMLDPTDIRENLCRFATDRGWDRRSQGCGVANVGSMNFFNVSMSLTGPDFPQATASPLVDESTDLAARATGPQSSSWQGASWQGASWQASSWQGVPV